MPNATSTTRLIIQIAGDYTPPPGTILFGTSTLAGAGGYAAPPGGVITGGTATGYSVSGGYLVPTSDASADSGTVIFSTGQTFTCGIVQGYYVRTIDELIAAAQVAGLALGTDIIVRDGSDINPTYDTNKTISRFAVPSGTFDGTNYVKIRPESFEGATLRALGFNGTGGGARYFSVEDFRVETNVGPVITPPTSGVLRLFSGAKNIRFHNNTIEATGYTGDLRSNASQLVSAIYTDPSSDIDGLVITLNRFNGCRYAMQVQGKNAEISSNEVRNSFDDTLQLHGWCDNLVVRLNNFTDKLNAYSTIAITNITQAANAVVTVADATDIQVGYVVILAGVTGMTGLPTRSITITAIVGNDVTVDLDTSSLSAYVSGGELQYSVFHPDHIQGNFSGVATQNNMLFEYNLITRGIGSLNWIDGQGIFLGRGDTPPTGTIIRGNILAGTLTQAIYLLNHINVLIENNSVVIVPDVCEPIGGVNPIINLFSIGPGAVVRNNLCHSLGTPGANTPTFSNNISNLGKTKADLDAVFANPQADADRAVVAADYAILPGAAAYLASPQIGAYLP